jgi:hypothetical protein
MPIKPPWHSSDNWKPTEVTQLITRLDSGAGTLIVNTDAGQGYLKALGNPDGPHALVKDFLGTQLACMLGLPTFDYAIVEVTSLDELSFFRGGQAESGPAFLTRGERGTVWGRDKRLLDKIDNPEVISGLVVIDTWLRNTDRYYAPQKRENLDNVFLSEESSSNGKLSLRAMDFSHAFKYGGELSKSFFTIATIQDKDVFGLFPEFRKRITRNAIRRFVSILKGLARSELEETVELVPKEWCLDPPVRTSIANYLYQRKDFVANRLEYELFGPIQLHFEIPEEGES